MNRFFTTTGLGLTAIGLLVVAIYYVHDPAFLRTENLITEAEASTTLELTLPFHYSFTKDGEAEEVGSMDKSTSPYWWVNSGAFLYLKDGLGRTVMGNLPASSKWRLRYAQNNPGETDDGYHPQNIFRLITRTKWQNFVQEASFRIVNLNLSTDSHRAASNGLFLMNRSLDGDNLYYTGLRVDGYAVIKKKKQGTYYTMTYKPVIAGLKYDRDTNPNLLPLNTWIRLKTEIKNLDAQRVSIKLYADIGNTGTWKLIADTIDDGHMYGGASMMEAGFGGIRTDFMDAEFDDYRLSVPK